MAKTNDLQLAGNRAKYERISFTLAPGQTAEKGISGEFIYCVDSNVGFDLGLDDDRPIESDIGLEYRQEQGEIFTKIRVKNTHATKTLSCAFLYGYGSINDRRLVPVAGRRVGILTQNFPTQLVGSALTSIAATTVLTFTGNPTGDQLQRESFVIQNLEALGGNDIQVNDSSGNVALLIRPQQSISFPTTDEIQVENTTGSAISIRAYELFSTNG